jgi:ATP-dependent DNA ligase
MSKKPGKVLTDVIDFFNKYLKLENGVITSNLYRKSSKKDKINVWSIFIEKRDRYNSKIDIIIDDISDNFVNGYAVYYTKIGYLDGKIRKTGENYVTEGKQGTNIITQTIKMIRKLYKNKITQLYKQNISNKSEQIFSSYMWKITPQLFESVNKNWNRVNFPCYIQPKVDGIRLLCVYNKNINVYTNFPGLGIFHRSRKIYKGRQPQLLYELYTLLSRYPGIYLDGELAIIELSFQKSIGLARRQYEEEPNLSYYIFDLFDSSIPSLTYEVRLNKLKTMFAARNTADQKIHFLETYLVKSYNELQYYMNIFIKEGYEGSIIRMPESKYAYSFTTPKRIKSVLKWKYIEDAEWKVVRYTSGTGEHNGAILFICSTENGIEFGISFVAGVFSIKERQKIYQYFQQHQKVFDKCFKNKMVTIQYQNLTESGIPIRGGIKQFRDEKIQKRLVEILYNFNNFADAINKLTETINKLIQYF